MADLDLTPSQRQLCEYAFERYSRAMQKAAEAIAKAKRQIQNDLGLVLLEHGCDPAKAGAAVPVTRGDKIVGLAVPDDEQKGDDTCPTSESEEPQQTAA